MDNTTTKIEKPAKRLPKTLTDHARVQAIRIMLRGGEAVHADDLAWLAEEADRLHVIRVGLARDMKAVRDQKNDLLAALEDILSNPSDDPQDAINVRHPDYAPWASDGDGTPYFLTPANIAQAKARAAVAKARGGA